MGPVQGMMLSSEGQNSKLGKVKRKFFEGIMEPTLLGLDRDKSLPRALIVIPALTLVVLCVLWITISVRLHIEKAAVLRETEDAAGTLARSLQNHTLKTVHDVDEIALLIKYGYESAPQTFDLAQYQARGLISADTALQVTIVGADGHVLASTRKFSGVVDLSDREHFLVHRSSPQAGLFISKPVIGRVSKQWSVQATRRIDRPDGTFGGAIVVSEDPAYLTDGFYNSAALGEHGLIAVVSRHGFTLSRRAGDALSTTGGPLPDAYSGVLGTRDSTVLDPVDHIERIVASRAIDRYDLMAVAGLSVNEALDGYFKMRRVYVTMALVISVILIGFSLWIMALVAKLLKGKEELRRLSETDRLTGLFNRGRIKDLLHQVVSSPDASAKVIDHAKWLVWHEKGDNPFSASKPLTPRCWQGKALSTRRCTGTCAVCTSTSRTTPVRWRSMPCAITEATDQQQHGRVRSEPGGQPSHGEEATNAMDGRGSTLPGQVRVAVLNEEFSVKKLAVLTKTSAVANSPSAHRVCVNRPPTVWFTFHRNDCARRRPIGCGTRRALS